MALHSEASQVVSAPREKAYAAYTDFEAMPKWSRQVKKVKVLKKDADAVLLQIGDPTAGRRNVVPRRLRLYPPERVESEGETRFTTTRSQVVFESVPDGTRVTASVDVKVKGLWARILTTRDKETAESSAAEELASFARYVEGLP